jgi:hypothetical protein
MIPVKTAAKVGMAAYHVKKHNDKKAEQRKEKEMSKQKDYRDTLKESKKADAQKNMVKQGKVNKPKATKAMTQEAEMARNNPYRRFQNEHDEKKSPVEKRKSSFAMTMKEEVTAMQADVDRKGLNAANKAQEKTLDR